MRPAMSDSLTSGQPLYLLYSNCIAPASAPRATQAIGNVRLHVTASPPTTSGARAACAESEKPNGNAAAAAPSSSDLRRWNFALSSYPGGMEPENYHQNGPGGPLASLVASRGSRGGIARRGVAHDDVRKGEHQDRRRNHQQSPVEAVVRSDVSHQQPRQRRDADVDQEAHRHVVGLEIDADHGAQLEVDEQQQDVLDGRMALAGHVDEGDDRRPDDGAADGKKREVVEAVDQERSETIDLGVHFRLPIHHLSSFDRTEYPCKRRECENQAGKAQQPVPLLRDDGANAGRSPSEQGRKRK